MKRITTVLVVFIFLAMATAVYANPPQKVVITYDAPTKTLTAVITHKVSDPTKHYIKKVNIAVNGQEIIEDDFDRQDNNNTQTLIKVIEQIKPGDKISVEAYCSISGKRKAEITVPAASKLIIE